jgi:hypothetical protein
MVEDPTVGGNSLAGTYGGLGGGYVPFWDDVLVVFWNSLTRAVAEDVAVIRVVRD